MRMRVRHISCIAALSFSLLLLPLPGAFGFGRGDDGPDVYAVQGMLKSLGYFSGSITGYDGKPTEAAVRLFQMANGLPVTGEVDDKTLESILGAYASVKLPKKQTPTPAPPAVPTPAPAPMP